MIKQVKDTKLSSDVKTPEKMVRNFKWKCRQNFNFQNVKFQTQVTIIINIKIKKKLFVVLLDNNVVI
jgi:hypothetical protein